ncbi:proteic killer suppression protein [Anoxybacillus tepidamans]|uniref:Proteic killer suppression protein n=1 Tax=Anoxybacteroides tepidamans TaxID=265948 RepID=A0A7W8MWQ4_9BACL|nr:type II toxin-antitoxin system RelE/ParE family toxin [Anoxybacillus tepidamans]MBB5324870.1 proteic killer suppression protein [Anoxybacillus tepidamans]
MDISFKNKKMEKVLNSNSAMQKEYGQLTRKIQQRLAELRAAPCLNDISHLPPPRLHQLEGERDEQFAVDVKHPFRIVFVPNHDPIPRKPDGGIDRSMVTAIKIIEVGVDYHGK